MARARRKKTARWLRALVVLMALGVLAVLVVGVSLRTYYKRAYPIAYENIIVREAEKNGLPVELVYAVCRTESHFRPQARSSIGARGVMQLTEETFDWVKMHLEPGAATSYDDMYDAETNIIYGTFLLKMLVAEFGSYNNALCAYHAGWGSATRWLENAAYTRDGEIVEIPFPDTRAYVEKVLKTAEKYRSLYDM